MKRRYGNDDPPTYHTAVKDCFLLSPPSYICTVYKQGYVKLKKELEIGGVERSKDRSWNTVYFRLQGTLLQIFKHESSGYPFARISMLKCVSGIAGDYKKFENVLRLRLGTTKEQYLIRPLGGLVQTISWFEHLQSSANISADIDKRRMPKTLTLSREFHNNQQRPSRTVTLTVGKTQAVVPLLKCNSERKIDC